MFNRVGDELTLVSTTGDHIDRPDAGVWEFKIEDGKPVRLIKDTAFSYKFPKKVYGDVAKLGNNILRTWVNRSKNTGVLLSGPQGVGKSLMAQYLINKGIKEHEAVVINVTKPIVSKAAFDMIAEIPCPVIVFIDEFEKIYNWEDQNKLLTYMDGGSLEGVLWLLTVNNLNAMGPYFFHRPSRIYYHIKYDNVEMSVVEDILNERLRNKKIKRDVMRAISKFSVRTYDTILSFIGEVNSNKEATPEEILNYLNIKKNGINEASCKYYYRIFTVDTASNEEDITREYNRKIIDNWIRRYDIFGDGEGFDINSFTTIQLISKSKLYPTEEALELNAETFIETENYSIKRFYVGKSMTDKKVYLEFSKEPYPEIEDEASNDRIPDLTDDIISRLPERGIKLPASIPAE